MYVSRTLIGIAVLVGSALGLAPLDPKVYPRSSDFVKPGIIPILGRQSSGVAALQRSITDVQQALNGTIVAVEPFRGGTIRGLLGLLDINSGVVALGDAIDKTTKIAESSGRLDQNQSITVGQQFLGTQPQITTLLTTLAGKRPEFDKAGFKILDVTSLIRDDLTNQQAAAKDLGTALTSILDPSLQPIAQGVNDQIQGNFSSTITAFAGRGGKIKIPTKAVPALSELLNAIAKALGLADDPTDRVVAAKLASAAGDTTKAQTNKAGGATISDAPADTNMLLFDDDVSRLGDDENDLRGIPLPVILVLRRFGII